VSFGAIELCAVCGQDQTFSHDHHLDNTGLDDGPDLHPQRKRAPPKPPSVVSAIRVRAWATRRAKYGDCGHG
jgi:hypothetical protein